MKIKAGNNIKEIDLKEVNKVGDYISFLQNKLKDILNKEYIIMEGFEANIETDDDTKEALDTLDDYKYTIENCRKHWKHLEELRELIGEENED